MPLNLGGNTTVVNLICNDNTFYYKYIVYDSYDANFGELDGYEKDAVKKIFYEQH
ncbi:MAG: hypothetical protein E6258_00305 [Campylobacter ureolyticus]|uniref:hypothetical protein n=1 Tax=Campylobacter ureolyticus TaxID=827 RepID=UPI0022B437E2|nr:hypothetical protein [Campylobacter ureolyticus]MCZ6103025.1 hypothetical protein [Campylobacter ureolyticus]MDU4981039.1 hypothetical protein [Campylobacter ureolyticus]